MSPTFPPDGGGVPPDGGWRLDGSESSGLRAEDPITRFALEFDATEAPYVGGETATEFKFEQLDDATSRPLRALETPQEIGLKGAVSYLERQGDNAIMVLDGGGPGGAPPDILSVTTEGKLRATEAKGTLAGTPLEKAGLEVGADPVTGDAVFENSPGWLAKGADKVIRRIEDAIVSAETAGRREELVRLLDAYLVQVETGFQEKDAYVRTVVQTGDRLEPLDSADLPLGISRYCAAVEPDAIVQQRLRPE